MGVWRINSPQDQYAVQGIYCPPVDYTADYVKATNSHGLGFEPWRATNPALSNIGSRYETSWMTASGVVTNQRFHIDLGSPKIIRMLVVNNGHHDGYEVNTGVNAFVLQGSNSASSFNELTYGTDTGWTALGCNVANMPIHPSGQNVETLYYPLIYANGYAYRYIALKIASNHGSTSYMNLRRVLCYE